MIFNLTDPMDCAVVSAYLTHERRNGKTVGLASGSFDLAHFQHVLFLARCRRMCDVLIVGVDSDELVRERKGEGRPIIYDSRRVVMVDALKPVAFAFIMGSVRDFARASELIRPESIFKNDAFAGRESEILGKESAGQIVIVRDVVEHSSTTEIVKAVARLGGKPSDCPGGE